MIPQRGALSFEARIYSASQELRQFGDEGQGAVDGLASPRSKALMYAGVWRSLASAACVSDARIRAVRIR